jgi:aminopeptidase N
MREGSSTTIHLKDYAPPAYLIDTVELDVDLRDDHATVHARLSLRRNPASVATPAPLQ